MIKIAFILLLIVHALIHVLGFIKAFELTVVKELTLQVSKTFGVLWLIGFLSFVIVALMFVLKSNYWWLFGFIAIFISQILIIVFWKDAKFGTMVNVLVLIAVIIGCGTWNFKCKFENEVSKGIQMTASIPDTLLTDADLQNLPAPVKKYIQYTGAVGKPKVKNFEIEFSGKLRKNEHSGWMPFSSVQYNFLEASTRLFFLNATMKYLPVAGFHSFKNGDAFMDIRLFSLIRVQYQSGKEMGTAETVTFFNDMCGMAPATLIDKRIKWMEGDSNKVKAEFTNNGITISANLYFNDKGELVNFASEDRYAVTKDNKMKKLRWSTPLTDYKEFDGHRLASYAEAIYTYPEGDLSYGNFKLTNIRYNLKDSSK
jgi:hypothetical protein